MDTVFIQGLAIEAIIGIYDWERVNRQPIIIDLEMATDIQKAVATEDVQYALNYKTIADRIELFVQESEFQLIETLAENIASIVRDEFGVTWLRLTLHKPKAVPSAQDVGLIIERGSR